MKGRWGAWLLGAAVACAAQSAAPPHSYQYFRNGAAKDKTARPRAGYALMGGGTDQDEAFRWLCEHADGGDFLVLRATGTDDYNPYVQGLCKLNSVATLILPDRASANDPFVATAIAHAAAVFIAGGDQANYIRNWAETPVERELRSAVRRGVPIGGTSAGLAVLGQYIYSAQNDLPDGPDLSAEVALADPFARKVVIAPDLLGIPILRGVITDSHFDTRHREGRLLAFMARILARGPVRRIRGIGIDEKTAVLVDPDGAARVMGVGEADFFEASVRPQECAAHRPLTFGPVSEVVVHTGERFDLRAWRGAEASAEIEVKRGKLGSGSAQ
ncbi:MAG TPA: cyanophycinase [Acidobacteriaceae bacterium]|jgi:cyanophycinase|nr:cyanophycinase [Acidobacteriaceae bacterium]